MCVFQFPITALREIKILQLLNHENVVNLIEICSSKGNNITVIPSSVIKICSSKGSNITVIPSSMIKICNFVIPSSSVI